jgi:hypothetical protein
MSFEYNKLNDDWINNFENTDKLYQDFYKDNLYYINLQYIYVNRSNEIDKIKSELFLMSTPNYILREEILGILKRNSFSNQKNYKLLSILKYNITLESDELTRFLLNTTLINNNYLESIKNIDTIKFENSINMFQDLNELVFIFYEKSSELKEVNSQTITKKVYIKSLNKRTIRKRYKD